MTHALTFSVLQTENMNPGPTGRSRRETYPMHESVRSGTLSGFDFRSLLPSVNRLMHEMRLFVPSLANKWWARRLPAIGNDDVKNLRNAYLS